jgi:sugar O-acyltransferase (sialic acid O-acetyltransferase NeuD family)
MKKEKIILIGGGGHCRSVIDVIEKENKYTIAGIIDLKKSIGNNIFDYTVIGSDEDLEVLFNEFKYAVVTLGHIRSNKRRKEMFFKLKEIGYFLPSVISPFAYVSDRASIDEGTVVMHHALLNSNSKVGKNCIINTKALIEHDVIVEDHCHISTASVLNGNVYVKENSFYGSNSVSKQGAIVEDFVKLGSIVI